MNNEKKQLNGWKKFVAVAKGAGDRVGSVFAAVIQWAYRLRKIFMTLPVLVCACEIAKHNMEALPEMVGFDIQATGEFAQMISRETAVYGPLGLTCFCLILVLISRRTVYPWLVSIFTLTLPVLIYAMNVLLV